MTFDTFANLCGKSRPVAPFERDGVQQNCKDLPTARSTWLLAYMAYVEILHLHHQAINALQHWERLLGTLPEHFILKQVSQYKVGNLVRFCGALGDRLATPLKKPSILAQNKGSR